MAWCLGTISLRLRIRGSSGCGCTLLMNTLLHYGPWDITHAGSGHVERPPYRRNFIHVISNRKALSPSTSSYGGFQVPRRSLSSGDSIVTAVRRRDVPWEDVLHQLSFGSVRQVVGH